MNASIIITGSEILKGVRQDALIQPLAAMMISRGLTMGEVRVIGDDPRTLVETILGLEASSDLIIVTGGLGLTPDDTTHTAIRTLVSDRKAVKKPEIENPVGSARGTDLLLESGTRVVFFPGVPRETLAMFALLMHGLSPAEPSTGEVSVFGLRETEIAKRLGKLADSCGFLPREMEVAVIVPKDSEQEVRRILGIHAMEGQDLNTTLGTLLKREGLTCATAESCTGGLIAHLITQLPGSSAYFKGAVVAYSNDIKVKLLGVPEESIAGHGAVSREVAGAMLEGILRATGADVGMATTGIAGPAGGSEEKPVGTVWIAAGRKDEHVIKEYRFQFDRQGNKMIFAKTALFLLRTYIHDTVVHSV